MSDFNNSNSNWEMVPQKNGYFSKILSIILVLAIGFASGSIFSNYNKSTEVAGSNENNIIQNSTTKSPIVRTVSSTNESYSIADIASATADSIVEISTSLVSNSSFFGSYTSEGSGSGIIISSDGYILTNNHVINGASKTIITLHDGKEYEATLVGHDNKTDVAILKIEATGLSPVSFGDSSSLRVGDLAVVIGNPLGRLGGTVTSGIISALEREITLDGITRNLIQTDAAINPGNSGGGLFNSAGELVGIIVAKSSGSDVEGLGFAIPVNDVKDVINDLQKLGYVTNRPFLGLSLGDNVSSSQSSFFGMTYSYQSGALVKDVVAGSGAEKSGIKVGDIVTSFNGQSVVSASEVVSLVSECKIGDTVELIIVRDSKTQTVKVTLGEYKGE